MKRNLRMVLILFAVLTLMPLAGLAESDDTATNAEGMPYVLDAFEGTDLDLTQYEGKAIWLNFFTQWCPHCMTEMPYIKQVFDEYDPDQLAIVLIHAWSGEDADASKAVIEEYGLQDMIMIEDDDMSLCDMVGLQGFPTSYFIDKDGYLYGGTYSLDYDGMVAYMDGMDVGKRPADTTSDEATATPAPEAET